MQSARALLHLRYWGAVLECTRSNRHSTRPSTIDRLPHYKVHFKANHRCTWLVCTGKLHTFCHCAHAYAQHVASKAHKHRQYPSCYKLREARARFIVLRAAEAGRIKRRLTATPCTSWSLTCDQWPPRSRMCCYSCYAADWTVAVQALLRRSPGSQSELGGIGPQTACCRSASKHENCRPRSNRQVYISFLSASSLHSDSRVRLLTSRCESAWCVLATVLIAGSTRVFIIELTLSRGHCSVQTHVGSLQGLVYSEVHGSRMQQCGLQMNTTLVRSGRSQGSQHGDSGR